MPAEPTLSEVLRVVERIEKAQGLLNEKVDTTFVRRDVYESDNNLRNLVQVTVGAWQEAHQETHRWIARTIGAALIVTLTNVIVILARVKV